MSNLRMAMVGVGIVAFTLLFASCGKVGPMGPAGVQGQPGQSITGAVGATGSPGVSPGACVVAATASGATVTCPGSTPVQISNGTSPTPVTAVQFCPGYTTTYPNTFAEQGICLSGILYGVYDGGANDVFLSPLPPGEYESTSTGAPCDFNVVAGCTITN